jgi:hypothetical protein
VSSYQPLVSPRRARGTRGGFVTEEVRVALPLPPLPRLADDAFWEPGGRSVVDVLAAEHRRLGALCAWLAEPHAPGRRREIADVVVATVVRHLSAEEQYAYPSVRAALADGDAAAARETARDRRLLHALAELSVAGPADPPFDRLVREVTRLLAAHRSAVDGLLARLSAEVADADLVRLGNRVETAAEAAPTRPHPRAPVTPPWNRVVDPVLGLVDRVRDGLARRSTYPRDL